VPFGAAHRTHCVRQPRVELQRRVPRNVAVLTAGVLEHLLYCAEGRHAATGKVRWQIDTDQSAGGGIVTYRARGRQLLAMATGMKSPIWPGGANASRIVVYGLPGR